MQPLSKKQVDVITSDVVNENITFSHLADDLIDHICCEVESLMSNGKDFTHAYEMVKQQFEKKSLQKIQEDTIYLIDKKYRRMKTTMKITGNISMAMLGIGTVMKILHFPGSNLMLMLGFVILCLLFFPSAIYTNYKEQKIKGSKLLHLSILLGGILFMSGVLFKILHLNGASILLMSGWVFILFIFLPILLFTKIKEAPTKNRKRILTLGIVGLIIFELSTMLKIFHLPGANMLMILGSITLVSIFLPIYSYSDYKEGKNSISHYIYLMICTMFFFLFSVLLSINVSADITRIYANNQNNSSTIKKYLNNKNQLLLVESKLETESNQIADSLKKILHKTASDACLYIDSIKITLIANADKIDENKAKEIVADLYSIQNKYDTETVNSLLLGTDNKGLASKLKLKINQLEQVSTSSIKDDKEIAEGIVKMISTSSISIGQESVLWEEYSFRNTTIIGALTILEDLEKRIRMVENQTLAQIIKQNSTIKSK